MTRWVGSGGGAGALPGAGAAGLAGPDMNPEFGSIHRSMRTVLSRTTRRTPLTAAVRAFLGGAPRAGGGSAARKTDMPTASMVVASGRPWRSMILTAVWVQTWGRAWSSGSSGPEVSW